MIKVKNKKEIKTFLNKQFKIFIVAVLIGVQVSFLIFYMYSLYQDRTSAGEKLGDTISYQGKITNSDGVPPPDGQYNMQFIIYDAYTSGNELWRETWDDTTLHGDNNYSGDVTVTQGIFTVELNSLCENWVGSCATSGGVSFANESFYLEVKFDPDGDRVFDETFTPRKRFTAIPYSMNTDKLDGRDYTEFVLKSGDTVTGDLTVNRIIDDSLVAYYAFNNDVYDSSKNGLDGATYNTPSTDEGVLELDGVNQYVSVPDDDLLSFGDGSNDDPFTISAWVNMIDAENFEIVSKGVYAVSGAEYQFVVYDTNKQFSLYLYDSTNPANYIGANYSASLDDYEGVWTHLAATYDASKTYAGVTLYINGESVSITNDSYGTYTAMNNKTTDLFIGRNLTNHTNGNLDDLKIFNRELSSDEIKRLYEDHNRVNVHSESISTKSITFTELDDEDGDGTKEIEGGNLIWDEIYNRFKFDSNLFAPNIIPYFNNTVSDRDYTHIVDSNKIIAYDFNASSGTTVVDLMGNKNASLQNNATWINEGYIGYGVRFDGDTSYMSIESTPTLADDGTIEMWLKLDDYTRALNEWIFFFGSATSNRIDALKNSTGDLLLGVGSAVAFDSGYNFTDNNWHHLVIIWESDSNIDAYMDGVDLEISETHNVNTSTFSAFFVGSKTTVGPGLLGSLDSFAAYSDVLSEQEIINHYNASFHNLYVDNISDGIINTSLENLIDVSATLGENNTIDPAYFNDGRRILSLPFSEGFGATTASLVNSLSATINGATWIKAGYYGHALDFDGTDDNLVISHASAIDLTTEDFSIEMWVKGSVDGNDSNVLISKKDSNAGFEISLDSSDKIVVWLGDGTDTHTSTGWGLDMSNGQWGHFFISVDRTADTININNGGFSNHGSLIDFSSANIDSLTNSGDLYIASDSTGNYFEGKLDSVVLYKNGYLNLYDSYARITNAPESNVMVSNTTASGYSTVGVINQSSNSGSHAFSAVLTNSLNIAGFPISLFNLANTSDVYNMISFGTVNATTYAQTNFGNLTWDEANTKFILDQSLEVQGDLEADYLITDTNELLAFDIERITIDSTDVTNSYCQVAWNTATTKKIANMHALMVDESHANDLLSADDWTNTATAVDLAVNYDGTNITVYLQSGAWAVDDIVTVFISYEK